MGFDTVEINLVISFFYDYQKEICHNNYFVRTFYLCVHCLCRVVSDKYPAIKLTFLQRMFTDFYWRCSEILTEASHNDRKSEWTRKLPMSVLLQTWLLWQKLYLNLILVISQWGRAWGPTAIFRLFGSFLWPLISMLMWWCWGHVYTYHNIPGDPK